VFPALKIISVKNRESVFKIGEPGAVALSKNSETCLEVPR